jgi:putative Holliday junction resolvase
VSDVTALGFDYGERRIGVAVGQSISRTATPLMTLPAHAGQPNWNDVQNLIREWGPEVLIVGKPSTMDGNPHPLLPAVERFAGRLHGRFGLPIEFVDERLSSHEAQAVTKLRDTSLDAMSARLILETWLTMQSTA